MVEPVNAPDWLTAVASVAAIGISVWALLSSNRANKTANHFQGRLVNLEQARERDRLAAQQSATLRAYIVRGGRSSRLVIANEGQSQARSIRLLLNSVALADFDHAIPPEGGLQPLGPGGEFSILLSPVMGGPDTLLVHLMWDDDARMDASWESTLSFV